MTVLPKTSCFVVIKRQTAFNEIVELSFAESGDRCVVRRQTSQSGGVEFSEEIECPSGLANRVARALIRRGIAEAPDYEALACDGEALEVIVNCPNAQHRVLLVNVDWTAPKIVRRIASLAESLLEKKVTSFKSSIWLCWLLGLSFANRSAISRAT